MVLSVSPLFGSHVIFLAGFGRWNTLSLQGRHLAGIDWSQLIDNADTREFALIARCWKDSVATGSEDTVGEFQCGIAHVDEQAVLLWPSPQPLTRIFGLVDTSLARRVGPDLQTAEPVLEESDTKSCTVSVVPVVFVNRAIHTFRSQCG